MVLLPAFRVFWNDGVGTGADVAGLKIQNGNTDICIKRTLVSGLSFYLQFYFNQPVGIYTYTELDYVVPIGYISSRLSIWEGQVPHPGFRTLFAERKASRRDETSRSCLVYK